MSKIFAALLVTGILSALYPEAVQARADGALPANGEVEILRAGPRVMYRFVDDNGDIVIQDRPPEWYKIPEIEVVEPWEPPARNNAPGHDRQPPRDLASRVLTFLETHHDWLIPLGFLLAALRFIGPRLPALPGLPSLPALGKTPGVRKALRRARFDTLHDLVLPQGNGGVTRIDHLARTPSGLLLLHREQAEGIIAGCAEDRVWAEDCAGRQRTLENPIAKVDSRLETVRALVPDLPVFGRVVLIGGAQFRDGVPAGVLTPLDLGEVLQKFKPGKISPATLERGWQALGRHAGRDSEPARATTMRDPKKITGFALLGLAFLTFLIL